MLSLSRTMEVLLFSLCNFGPYVALSYYAFHKHFRYSKAITILGCVALFTVQFVTRYWSAIHNINSNLYMSIFRLIIFVGVYAILINQRFGKILFIELIFANLGNFILIAAVCLEQNLFPHVSHLTYCWHSSLVMMLLHILFTIPFIFSVKIFFIPMLDNHLVKKEWYYYWIVPFVFYIIWQYQINGNAQSGLENIKDTSNIIFLFIINIGAILIYYIMLMLDGQLAKNFQLEEEKHYHDLEYMEFQSLKERMEETRQMRHDMRHHMHMVNYYLKEKEYDKLREYVNVFEESIPDGDHIRFCEHKIINNIIFYFAAQARKHQIDFDARLHIPESFSVKEHDISVLLGNLLENALDACTAQQSGSRRIVIRGKGDEYSLVFTIDNSFENDLKKNKKGEFLTTKSTGSGIGVNSSRKIVERYHGFFSADKKGDMFCVSFVLNL